MRHLADLDAVLAPHHLQTFGAFHPEPDDATPVGCETLVLLGPAEPGFWAHVSDCAEVHDGAPDPLDRWSRRVIGHIACGLGAKALFPFSPPPHRPFVRWAERSGRAWQSPVGILVHDTAGLMASYRGALALRQRLRLPSTDGVRPCETCAQPCLTACPTSALTGTGYDLAACHGFLDRPEGQGCMDAGCLVRRACPLSQGYGRSPEQSAFHMRSFHPCP